MMREYTERPAVVIDGTPLDRALEAYLERVVVDGHLHLPDTFAITLRDPSPARDVFSRLRANIGSTVSISATPKGGLPAGLGSEDLLIEGTITALEGEYEGDASRLVIRGYDASHRLTAGRRTEAHVDVTDGDLATKVAQRAGLQLGQIDDPGTLHPHMPQAGLTDWEFLRQRASELNYDVTVVEGKLDFRPVREASEAPGEGDYRSTDPRNLVRGKNLLRYYPRVTAAQQVQEVEVRGWDPTTKEAVVATASAGTTSASISIGSPGQLAERAGQHRLVVAGRPYATQAEADMAAAAVAERVGSGFAEADGVAVGHPMLKPAIAVHVSGVAEPFAGRYTLTQTRHVFDDQGYRTHFTVSGRQDRSLLGLVGATPASARSSHGSGGAAGLVGLAVAIVSDVEDPDDMGRVKLKFPTLADDYVSHWARVVHAGAGAERGAFVMPEVDDEVLVAFESGDIRRPFVLGGLYNGDDKPPLGDRPFKDGRALRRSWVSREGHGLILHDDSGNRVAGIELTTKDAVLAIRLAHSDKLITIDSEGSIEISADGDLTLDAGGNLVIKASGNLELQGDRNVTLKAGATVDIDGAMIELN